MTSGVVGVWLIAVNTGQRLVDGGRPVVLSVLPIWASGAALLERSLIRRREGLRGLCRPHAFFPRARAAADA